MAWGSVHALFIIYLLIEWIKSKYEPKLKILKI